MNREKEEKMTEVGFYDSIEDELIEFAVIITKSNGKWVFCKHKERDTYEIPGGHREKNEEIDDTARRELYEETGAVEYTIKPVCIYNVIKDSGTMKNSNVRNAVKTGSYGKLYYAEVSGFEKELHSEIEYIIFSDKLIDNWTYPLIQPRLLEEAGRRGFI